MRDSLFRCLSSAVIAKLISNARIRICYVAPGIQAAVATALCSLVASNPKLRISISIDFSEAAFRMGYGSLEAVKRLKESEIEVVNSPGLRAAVLIVDDAGWVFTPTALYLEPEPHSEETPNSIRLTRDQVDEVVFRISAKEKHAAMAEAPTQELRERVERIVSEIGMELVSQTEFETVDDILEQAPAVKFDVARQVRVFEPYLQYVDLSLRGAAIQRQRIRIPGALLRLGSSEDLEGRLRTTFDLIERNSQVSSKRLEKDLYQLRTDLTRPLGKFGRVMLKAARSRFDERIGEFRVRLESHKNAVEKEIEGKLKASREQVIEYYLSAARTKPPDELVGRSVSPNLSDNLLREWIDDKLDDVFPSADEVVSNMSLDVSFKDVTFETLNDPEFIGRLKEAYPDIDWEKPYSHFRAMGEDQKTGRDS
jgi:hypothetical protein